MGKKIYWSLVVLIALGGVTTMIYYGIQPRPIPKIRLSQFSSPAVLADSILLRLREEIQRSPVLFLGIQPEFSEHNEIWKQFLLHNQEAGMKYDVVVAEQELPNVDNLGAQEKMATQEQSDQLIQGIENALAAGKRVAVIVPTIYSAQMIQGNLVNQYKQQTGKSVMSLSLSHFPRRREDEKKVVLPCVVEGVDQTGVGPFGCMVVQTARGNYRKRYESGAYSGLVEQIGLTDYLVLYAQEP